MLRCFKNTTPISLFTKKHYYEELHRKYGRTEKSFEYRMQNISYVLSLMGRNWLPGLKPAKNIGAKNAGENWKDACWSGRSILYSRCEFWNCCAWRIDKPLLHEPIGNVTPKIIQTKISAYQRDAKVKAWVLKVANGICEGCGNVAPFYGTDGIPYLEVHHIRQLADGGSDTITNAVALCPNAIEKCTTA